MTRPGLDMENQVETTANTGYTISVTPSIDTVERTVTVDGTEFTVDAIGKVYPGETFTVTVTAPDEDYSIEVRDLEEWLVRLASQKQGDTTVTFDSGPTDKDAMQPRSYGIAPVKGGTVKAFHPLVVNGYEVVVRAPSKALAGAETEIQATIKKLPSERDIPSISHLEAAIWSNGSETRHTMEKVSEKTYRTAIDKSAGDYKLSVAVINTDLSDEYDSEPIAFSDPQPLTVVENNEQLSEDWSISTASRLQHSRPAADADTVFVGGLGEEITARDRGASGGTQWTFERDGSLSDASPVLANGTLYVASGGGSLYALDPDASEDNRVSWSVNFDSALTSTPAVLNGTIYAGTNDGRVIARATSDGSKVRTTAVGGPVYSTVETSSDTVFVTTNDGDVVALNTNGSEEWRYSTGTTLGAASPVHKNGSVYVAGKQVFALDAGTGNQRWSTTNYHGSAGSTPAVDAGTVYVGDRAGVVHAFDDTAGGERLWAFGFPGKVAARPAVRTDRLIVADLAGTVGVLKRDTGSWVSGCTLTDPIRSPVFVQNGDAFVGTRGGNVAVFQQI